MNYLYLVSLITSPLKIITFITVNKQFSYNNNSEYLQWCLFIIYIEVPEIKPSTSHYFILFEKLSYLPGAHHYGWTGWLMRPWHLHTPYLPPKCWYFGWTLPHQTFILMLGSKLDSYVYREFILPIYQFLMLVFNEISQKTKLKYGIFNKKNFDFRPTPAENALYV